MTLFSNVLNHERIVAVNNLDTLSVGETRVHIKSNQLYIDHVCPDGNCACIIHNQKYQTVRKARITRLNKKKYPN